MAKKILLIDDEEDMLQMVPVSLGKAGYEVLTEATSQGGLEKAKAARPDLILLDIMLPGMDGFEICEQLKSQTETKDIPIVFFTAMGTPDLEERVAKAGGQDYIVKPFEDTELREKIKKVLGE